MLPHCSKIDNDVFPKHKHNLGSIKPIYLSVEGCDILNYVNVAEKKLNYTGCCDSLFVQVECWLCNVKITKELEISHMERKNDFGGRIDSIRFNFIKHHGKEHENVIKFIDKYGGERPISWGNVCYKDIAKIGETITLKCMLCDKIFGEEIEKIRRTMVINIKRHLENCSRVNHEIARRDKHSAYMREEFLSIIDNGYVKSHDDEFCAIVDLDPICGYIFSWKQCICGKSFLITCKICEHTFKARSLTREHYSLLLSRHSSKIMKNYNYKDFIIYTKRETTEYLHVTRDTDNYYHVRDGVLGCLRTKLAGYKCIICGILYGNNDSNIPNEEIVLTHFAACTAANSSRIRDEGYICAIKHIKH